MTTECPPFLEPRLRLFLGADIIGSTSLKQSRLGALNSPNDDAGRGPSWFSAIQGFYFEAAQAFLIEWGRLKQASEEPSDLYGSAPTLWKTIGDEVLFAKHITDHRQIATTLNCWKKAVDRMRNFLKLENSALDVKCTSWLAGFPFRNREVVLSRKDGSNLTRIEDYYQENGKLLNQYYRNPEDSGVAVDYIGPSIDTGFRLSSLSSNRKMIVSVDVAYALSRTSFDGEVGRIDLFYDGSTSLKGVFGGSNYPVFWLDMSPPSSLAVAEDKLIAKAACNKEDIKAFCDAFYTEYKAFTFRPFIKNDPGRALQKQPSWYEEYHAALVKNFLSSLTELDPSREPEGSYETQNVTETDDKAFSEVIADLKSRDVQEEQA